MDRSMDSMNSMGHRVSHSMNDRSMVSHSMNDRSMVDNRVSHNRGSSNISSSRGRWVLGLSRVGHLSNIPVDVISVVVDSLDSAIRKVHGVRSLDQTSAIIGLGLLEGSLRVVIVDSVGVGVGGGLC